LEGDSSIVKQVGRVLELLDEAQETVPEIFPTRSQVGEIEAHAARIRAADRTSKRANRTVLT
jgi:hypothetical protein